MILRYKISGTNNAVKQTTNKTNRLIFARPPLQAELNVLEVSGRLQWVQMRGSIFSLLSSPAGSVTKSFIRTSPVIVPASLLNECFFSKEAKL